MANDDGAGATWRAAFEEAGRALAAEVERLVGGQPPAEPPAMGVGAVKLRAEVAALTRRLAEAERELRDRERVAANLSYTLDKLRGRERPRAQRAQLAVGAYLRATGELGVGIDALRAVVRALEKLDWLRDPETPEPAGRPA